MIHCDLNLSLEDIYCGKQAGLDSLGAVEFRNAVSSAFAVQLPATSAFDYPTAAALAPYISAQLAPLPDQAARFVMTTRDNLGPILAPFSDHSTTEVVGMACVYPGSGTGVTHLMLLHPFIRMCPLDTWPTFI